MIFLVVVAALFAGYGTAYLASDDVRYLTRAGIEETRILQARQPIAELAADPRTDPGAPRRPRPGGGEPRLRGASSASRPRRPTPPTPTSGATRCCWCCRRRRGTASARTPGSTRSSAGSRTRGSSIPRRPAARPTGWPRAGYDIYLRPSARLLHPGLVQRPAALHRAHRRLGRAGGARCSTRSRTTRST